MKFIIPFVLALCLVTFSEGQQRSKCTYEDLRQCFVLTSQLSSGSSRYPNTVAGVEEMCAQLAEDGNCFQAFNDRCNTDADSREWLDDLRATLSTHNDRACSTEEARTEFLERMECYRKPNVAKEFLSQHRRYVAMIEKIPKYAASQRTRAICCAQLFLEQHARETVGKYCDKEIGDNVELLLGILFSNSFVNECGEVRTYDECIASTTGRIGSELNSIATDSRTPTTRNLFALPTIFRMWNDYHRN